MNTPEFLGPLVPLQPLHAAAATPLVGAGMNRTLPLVMQAQQADYWCWAATTFSVSSFYDLQSDRTQCQIASTCLTQPCCAAPAPSDKPFVLEVPLQTTGHLQGDPFPGPASRAQIQAEIDQSRVVCCFIDWSDFTGHFVTIASYDWRTDDLVIDDPLYARSTTPYEVLLASYLGRGSWTYTYLTQA